jgi:hypothetical protein
MARCDRCGDADARTVILAPSSAPGLQLCHLHVYAEELRFRSCANPVPHQEPSSTSEAVEQRDRCGCRRDVVVGSAAIEPPSSTDRSPAIGVVDRGFRGAACQSRFPARPCIRRSTRVAAGAEFDVRRLHQILAGRSVEFAENRPYVNEDGSVKLLAWFRAAARLGASSRRGDSSRGHSPASCGK